MPSHCAPETPGSIHEGGELGYSLSHAYGAVFDNPELVVACVIGDGEAETGPLAAAWHSNKFVNPAQDGAVLPVLHLNGYKIANPSVFARIPKDELTSLLVGYGHKPIFVEFEPDDASPTGNNEFVHKKLAAAMDEAFNDIAAIQRAARSNAAAAAADADANANAPRPHWPCIVLRSPKGWTGPKVVDGLPVENTWRSHQVPITDVRGNDKHRAMLEAWLKSYRPEELFDQVDGSLVQSLQDLAPRGKKRMGDSPYSNPGVLRSLVLPDFAKFGVALSPESHGQVDAESTRVLGKYLAAVVTANPTNLRIFGPDETASNRLGDVVDTSDRAWMAERLSTDDHLSPTGRVVEILSEHTVQGWMEGYTLTGRHALASSYEGQSRHLPFPSLPFPSFPLASSSSHLPPPPSPLPTPAFIPIVDSMVNQHAKWLKVASEIPWRKVTPSVNLLLSSGWERQDHNGFSHQDTGFLDHVAQKQNVRVYLPPDANTLLCIADKCLRSSGLINVIVASKHFEPQWLDMESAMVHCSKGLGIWRWASTDQGCEPDVVMCGCGDVATLEILAAIDLLVKHVPSLKVRMINVVDLLSLENKGHYVNGLSDVEFDSLFTTNTPVVFAYHGTPSAIHRLIYRRTGQSQFHVHGYHEQGTTTTPQDMLILNKVDRFNLAIAAIDHVPRLQNSCSHLRQSLVDALSKHKQYIRIHGDDMPVITDWRFPHVLKSGDCGGVGVGGSGVCGGAYFGDPDFAPTHQKGE